MTTYHISSHMLTNCIHKAIAKHGHAYPVGTRNWEDGILEDEIKGHWYTFFYFDVEPHGTSDVITLCHDKEGYEFYKKHLTEEIK